MRFRTATRYANGLALVALIAASGVALAEPDAATQGTVPPAAQPQAAAAAPASNKKAEVLPWANAPLAPTTAGAPPAGADTAALDTATAQCSPLFEAACRDLKACAWVADVALQDGTLVPARCVARPPAPPKAAAKKTPSKPKKVTEGPADAAPLTAAPAVKAAVTRIEDTEPGGDASKAAAPAPPKPEKKKTAATPEPSMDLPSEPAKTVEKKPEAAAPPKETAAEAPPAAKPDDAQAKPEKAADAGKSPIVVKPPAKEEKKEAAKGSAPGPSFGSFSSAFPGAGSAVVVTVPPSE